MNIIQTILRNLISNAIKYTNKGGVITLDCIEQDNSETPKIIVSDTGVGIPSKNLKNLFNVDNDLTTDGTEKEKGTGLGLHLCNELVEIIGGKIEVDSKVGQGSEFTVIIPQNHV